MRSSKRLFYFSPRLLKALDSIPLINKIVKKSPQVRKGHFLILRMKMVQINGLLFLAN